ncbi:MAG: 2-oxo acid dehydrogenase subunit E2 [Treponema sp.]|jgi:pyruvate dehydrogenase E2 component (dihydrolipoamide acetyltransferase)|nr:2-oxo acid dehydrogenase subunit E2 [Treponema sp.]
MFDIRQKVIASSTSLGWTAPHVSYVYEADVTEWLAELDTVIDKSSGANKITLNTLLMRVVVEGIKAAPCVNAHVFYNKWLAAGRVKVFDRIDINTPVLLPDKRMVTVKLPDCGNKSLEELAFCHNRLLNKLKNTNIDIALLNVGWEDTIKKLKQGDIFTPMGRILGLMGKNRLGKTGKYERDAYNNTPKESRLCNDDLNMGTITVSNLGAAARGTSGFPAVINLVPPQVMAIGIGALQEKAVVYKSRITGRKIIPFCIVFDHRALDFGDAAPLIKAMDLIFQGGKTKEEACVH